MRALVSASDVIDVLSTHVDRVHDAAVRLGCSPVEASEVTVAAVTSLVEDLATRPETVGDLVGGLYARCRRASGRVRRGPMAAPVTPTAGDPLTGEHETAAVAAAVADLPERRRLGVLLVDSYAVTYAQTAVALDLDVAETARTIALGRTALVAAVDGRQAPSLSGHDTAIGDLGQLSDGSAPAGGRFAGLRRHVSSCATCADNLGVQTRGQAMVRALPVVAVPAAERTALLDRAAERARAVLLSHDQVQAELAGEVAGEPLLPRYVWVLALVLALILGAGVGALLGVGGSGASSPSAAADTTASAVTAVSAAAASSATAAGPDTSAPAASVRRSATLTARGSAPPASVPTRATLTAAPAGSSPVRPAATTTVSISPTGGPAGTALTVSGIGFGSGERVSVTYQRADGTVEGSPRTATTDGAGAFTVTITADDPPTTGLLVTTSHAGQHEVVASGAGLTATAPFDQTS